MLAKDIEINGKYKLKDDEWGAHDIIVNAGSKVRVLKKSGKSIQVKDLSKHKVGNGIWWTISKNIKEIEA